MESGLHRTSKRLQSDDQNVIRSLDFRDLAMSKGAGDSSERQFLALPTNVPHFIASSRVLSKTTECLIQKVMGMCQPDDFMTLGQRAFRQKASGSERFAATRREDQNSALFRLVLLLPLSERFECIFLVWGRWVAPNIRKRVSHKATPLNLCHVMTCYFVEQAHRVENDILI